MLCRPTSELEHEQNDMTAAWRFCYMIASENIYCNAKSHRKGKQLIKTEETGKFFTLTSAGVPERTQTHEILFKKYSTATITRGSGIHVQGLQTQK